jgi:pyridoxal phosphate enzyme (YggS family)
MQTIADNLTAVRSDILAAEQQFGRSTHSVSLLAVSKTQPVEKIREAYAAGQTAFGENYLQEALTKITALADLPLEWHFIGPIQSNKTRKIAAHFAWVHSVCDSAILKRLQEQRPDTLPPLNICLQVNISHEATKSGITDENILLELAEQCAASPRLRLRGLMTIPAEKNNFSEQRAAFHKMQQMSESLCKKGIKLDTLSMGMSNDLAAAIAEGSTMVRIGTKIFGNRE